MWSSNGGVFSGKVRTSPTEFPTQFCASLTNTIVQGRTVHTVSHSVNNRLACSACAALTAPCACALQAFLITGLSGSSGLNKRWVEETIRAHGGSVLDDVPAVGVWQTAPTLCAKQS